MISQPEPTITVRTDAPQEGKILTLPSQLSDIRDLTYQLIRSTSLTPSFRLPSDFFSPETPTQVVARIRESYTKLLLGLRSYGYSPTIFLPRLSFDEWLKNDDLLAIAGDFAAISNTIGLDQVQGSHPSIFVVTGPMFSGKSESLQQTYHELIESDQDVVVTKPRGENRYGEKIKTHNQHNNFQAGLAVCHYLDDLSDLRAIARENLNILVEEAMFMNPDDLLSILRYLPPSVLIYLYGLDTDFQQRPFRIETAKHSFGSLMVLAQQTEKLHAQTNYPHKEAPQFGAYSARRELNSFAVEVQGGAEMYYVTDLENHPETDGYSSSLTGLKQPTMTFNLASNV